ncbi:MAG: glycoside hydrolase family 108 protein [Thermodesulfobacteriota bacterium]
MSDFDRAMEFVFKWEGGYVYDARDPGGETKWGISRRTYPTLDIKDLTKQEAEDIYRHDYWEKLGCDNLLWPVNLVVFDTAVNMGGARAKDFLSRTPYWQDYIIERIDYYARVLGRKPYLRGWINRTVALYRFCGEAQHPVSRSTH